MEQNIYKMVVDCLQPYLLELNNNETIHPETKVYASGSTLNSLYFIRLVVDLEEVVFDKFGKQIVIANEKALSMKQSPFRTVQSLTDYITLLLNAHE